MTDVPSDPSEADDRRTAQDELIIECLAAGMSYPQTGEIAGCTARTVSRRMADRDFARLVSVRRGERVRAIAGQLTALADDAVRTIRELLAGAERDADRLRAAHMVLTFVGRFRADTDLEDRLHDLEAQLDGNLRRGQSPGAIHMTLNAKRLDRIGRLIPEPPSGDVPGAVGDRATHITEFASDPRFLGKKLFPAQGSLLKAMTLDLEHMTAYDHKVYEQWGEGFVVDPDDDTPAWRGIEGTTPDLLDRIGWCRDQGRRWFREMLLLVGRRGSKGFIAGIFGAWMLHVFLTDGDPHERHGVDPGKRLSIVVFAGKKDQAVRNVFRDLKMTLLDSPWFDRYIARVTVDTIYLFTPRQLREGVDTSNHDLALIEIRASETTDLGQRGPAVITIFMDEFAHLQGAGTTANSVDIYNAATPATAQFGTDAAVVQTTSPWDKKGQAWTTYNRASAIDPDTGTATNPDFFMVQLPSDALYRDADEADTIPMWPGGPTYPSGLKPIFVFDEARLRDEQANPDSFAVEYRAQWRSSLDAYLPARFVDRLWASYKGERLAMTAEGVLGTDYFAHADPSLSQANFGLSICHLEEDDDGIPHVVYDVEHHWRPEDFHDGIVSYIEIGDELFDYICAFNLSVLTFDHWNSAEIIERLKMRVAAAGLPKQCRIFERTPTHELNLDVWELFKTALGHNLVHAPYYEQADLELRALEFHNGRVQIPDAGEVRTRDVADAMVYAFYNAFGDDARYVFARLANLSPRFLPGLTTQPVGGLTLGSGGWDSLTPQQQLSSSGRRYKNMHAAQRGPGSYNPARGGTPPRSRRRRW